VPFTPAWLVDQGWACAVVAVALALVMEGWLVAEMGGDHHPRYSIIATLHELGRRLARNPTSLGGAQGTLAALVGLALAVAVTAYAPWAVAVAAVAGHFRWARRRHRRWADYREERAALLDRAREELRDREAGVPAAAATGTADGRDDS
jgi:hypothetical protein